MDNRIAKDQLDTVIRKARVDSYKPIQIAEILRRDRIEKVIDLGDLGDLSNTVKEMAKRNFSQVYWADLNIKCKVPRRPF